jgi:serine/threonine protein kinase
MGDDRGGDDGGLATTRVTTLSRNTELIPVGFLVVGRYRVAGRLGAGGMGIVYAAEDTRTGRDVAIKVLNPGADTVGTRRFRREAEAAFDVKHQHLCDVLEIGFESGLPFIVMERLEGETLLDRLKAVTRLEVTESMRVAVQILEALATAHATGVIHRDVKPGNVFVLSAPGADPWTKLIDFGVAKALPTSDKDGDAWTPITALDMVPGTPAYLSPEQLRAEADLDVRVDVWATGVTLFEMLTGRRPFEARTYAELTRRITAEPPARAALLRPEVPLALERVIMKSLAKDRRSRFADAAEMRGALVDLLARRPFEIDAAELTTAPVVARPDVPDSSDRTTEVMRSARRTDG